MMKGFWTPLMPHRPFSKWHHWYTQPLGTPSASGRCRQPPVHPIPSNGLWPPSSEAPLTWHHRVCWAGRDPAGSSRLALLSTIPSNPTLWLRALPKHFLSSARLVLSPPPWGAVLGEMPFPNAQSKPLLTELQAIPPDLSLLMTEKRQVLPLRRML